MNYKVADNIFAVRVPDNLKAWALIRPRFEVFTVEDGDSPVVLDVEIVHGPIPDTERTPIYEPEYGGIGFIMGSASRTPSGTVVMEFRHIDEADTRLWMEMSTDFSKAHIVLDERSDNPVEDHYFLTHALMLAYMLATAGNGTLVIHSSCVVNEGKAYLFQGKSGTGKSTHSKLWLKHVPGTELLNDDNPIVRFTPEGVATAYGSPWSGKTPCYRNESAPIGAFVRIVRSADNALKRLKPLQAYASLTTSISYLPFFSEQQRAKRHETLERLVLTVPVCEMHCRPDREAAEVCHAHLMKI